MDNKRDLTVTEAWPTAVQQATKTRPWLAALLLQKGQQIFSRFAYHYQQLMTAPRKVRRQLGAGLATAALLLALSSAPVPAHAAEITVGDGCTLVQAIQSANTDTSVGDCTAGNGADTIVLAGGTYSYTTASGTDSALPNITSVITIEANGATIERTGVTNMRIIRVNAVGDLTLNNATITGGTGADRGGGIYNRGTTTLNNSTVSGNTATFGGGIYNRGTTTLNNSTVSGNTAANSGGGIFNSAASTTTLNNSTVSDNTAANRGGGIFNYGGTTTLNNSTVSGNTATNSGGGIYNFAGTTTLNRSIVSGNTSSTGAEVRLRAGTITAANHNVFGHSGLTNAQAFAGGFAPSGTDVNATSDGTNTLLANILYTTLDGGVPIPTLADNGGPTLTHALVTGSPAIDIIPTDGSVCVPGTTADQRGAARANGLSNGGLLCDAGAFEFDSEFTPTAVTNLQTDVTTPAQTGWLVGVLVGLLGASTAVFLRRHFS